MDDRSKAGAAESRHGDEAARGGPDRGSGGGLTRFLKDNGLSLAFIGLFLLCLIGESLAGYFLQRENPAAQLSIDSFAVFLRSSKFFEATASNWQAALLQLLALILFSIFLRQRGASHSRKSSSLSGAKIRKAGRDTWIERRSGWLFRNSLSLAFLLLFAVSFGVHIVAGCAAYNAERLVLDEEPLSVLDFLQSAKFWFSTLQTWQAEFFAIAAFLILTIYLRQEHSAESKPVDASQDETGEVNE